MSRSGRSQITSRQADMDLGSCGLTPGLDGVRRGCRVHAVPGPVIACRRTPYETLLAYSCCGPVSCCEVESLQVGGAGAVQGLAGPPGVEPDQVDGGGCGVVFQAGSGQAEVAGAADAGDVGGLGDGAFDPGADPVPALPGVAGLLGAGGGDGL